MNENKTCWQMQLLRNPENKSHTRGKYNGGNCSCQVHATVSLTGLFLGLLYMN